ncbi:MAG: helicase-exonuclease AddAB subunit AddA [Oscillospiraceae bacterium]|nr:helicase-exonuclease AddAB subunit AddA [Oscillospiraceae bacterium]
MSNEKREWTDDQKDAINSRNGTVIVSAAAGSGKTSVLVERIIQRLTDKENGCDADKLLIVTFTRAATAEMHSRLSDAINEELKKNPYDSNLQRQQMLLPSANIYTIDAFCANLVREHFESIKDYKIHPDFSPLDEGESKVLQSQAMQIVLDELYSNKENKNFKNLLELLFHGKDDSTLEDNIRKLYNYSRAYPSPNTWLDSAVSEYNPDIPLNESPIGKAIVLNAVEVLDYAIKQGNSGIEAMSSDEEATLCNSYIILKNELELCEKLKVLIEDYNFSEANRLLNDFSFSRWSTPKGKTGDPIFVAAKASRDLIKKILTEKLPKIISQTNEDALEDIKTIGPLALELVNATKRFSDIYMELKLQINKLDFSDISHFALELLVKDPSKDNFEKTELALDISNSFEEILIDEYQDTNKAQDMIFRAISRDENNLFMVGDVKQSIYGFRQAMPEIFLEKKNSFDKFNRDNPKYPATITLGQNFRSRKGVTDYVNHVFTKVMSKSCGDVNYNNEEKLVYGAKYDNINCPDTEFHIVKTTDELTSLESQTEFIAKYITNRVKNEPDTNYRDFTILMQTVTGKISTIEKKFKEYGIPVYSDVDSGFFSTPDIQIMTSLLKVIDNPLLDVPMLSVLLSPIFGFTLDDMAKIRINSRKTSLYHALLLGEKAGFEKCIEACKALRLYRTLSVSLPAGELIRRIYDDTLFPTISAALPNGAVRRANLMLLQKYADDYDRTSTYGISGFVRYIEKMEENDMDTNSANEVPDSANVVRVMSIHKSKGLEFKNCILLNTDKQFNKRDLNANVILHPTLGVGIKGRNFESGNTYPCLVHSAIKLEVEKNLMSENIRVLYVALTRAKERLIIVGGTKDEPEKFFEDFSDKIDSSGNIAPYTIRSASSFMNILLPATLTHPSAKLFRDYCSTGIPVVPTEEKILCMWHDLADEEPFENKENQADDNKLNKTDEFLSLVQDIKQRMEYEYPFKALSNITTKRAASHLNDGGFSEEFFASTRPEFRSRSGLTPAERGTCLHKFMQYADFKAVENNIDEEIKRLSSLGFLTIRELSSIDPQKVYGFLNSPIYERMNRSQNIMREKKFAVLVPAGNFEPSLPDNQKDEPVLIQGIADCVFEENGNLILVDYKTDNTKDENVLIERHKPQLETYVSALTECLGMPVTEAYIYSFSLDKEIRVI